MQKNNKNFSKDEKRILICEEQIKMIIKNHDKYESNRYKELESLKVKIKDLGE